MVASSSAAGTHSCSFTLCFLAADLVRGGENTNDAKDVDTGVPSCTKLATGGPGGETSVGAEKLNCSCTVFSSMEATGGGTTIVADGTSFTTLNCLTGVAVARVAMVVVTIATCPGVVVTLSTVRGLLTYEVFVCFAASMYETNFFFFASIISEVSRGVKRLGLFPDVGVFEVETRRGVDTAGEDCEWRDV